MKVEGNADDLPDVSDGRAVLKAQRVQDDYYSEPDVVISWSTDCGPYDLIMRCPAVVPYVLPVIEIIADEMILTSNHPDGLLAALQHRSVVRFNASNWSVIWMAATRTEGAQIQAVFKQVPDAMAEIVRNSITGRLSERVSVFFERLHAALAA